jgi:hypothetical protein
MLYQFEARIDEKLEAIISHDLDTQKRPSFWKKHM